MIKSDLFKELGWDDRLIQHFMIKDSVNVDNSEEPLLTEVYDSHSMTVTFNSENSGSRFSVKG